MYVPTSGTTAKTQNKMNHTITTSIQVDENDFATIIALSARESSITRERLSAIIYMNIEKYDYSLE